MQFLIVDDDFLSRGGMALTLRTAYPNCVVHEARGIGGAMEALATNPTIGLVLLDLNVEDSRGIYTLKSIQQWCEQRELNPKLIVVSGQAEHDETLIPEAIEHCATGFITKGTSEEVFRSAIQLTLDKAMFIPESYLKSRRGRGSSIAAGASSSLVVLTPRERDVAQLLVQGLSYKQIAKKLAGRTPGRSMSDHTVRVHVQRIAWKIRLAEGTHDDGLPAKAVVLTAIADRRLRLQ